MVAERPVLFKNEGSIVWQLPAAIVIRFQDLNPRGGIDQIGLHFSDIQPNTQHIITRKQRQAGDFADPHLRTDKLRVIQARLKDRVRGKDALTESIIKSQTHIKR